MSAVDVRQTDRDLSIDLGGFTLTATGIKRDRDVSHAVISLRAGERLIIRDRISLTSARARNSCLERHRSLLPPEVGEERFATALLSLEAAVGRAVGGSTPRPVERPGEAVLDEPVIAPASLAALEAFIGEYLLLDDPDVLRVVLAVRMAHQLTAGDAVWLLLVAPPSGSKTEFVSMLSELGPSEVFPLSELTAKTLASGLDEGQGDPSLLTRLDKQILLFKDFTTILEMHRDERQAVLAQLREVYDGRFDKAWGTGKELHWQGRLGFVAGVTPVIDTHHSVMAVLGPRFLQLRVRPPASRQAIAARAMANSTKKGMQRTIARTVAAFLSRLRVYEPDVPPDRFALLTRLADFVTTARSAVQRTGYGRELDYAPSPEIPGRFARQLFSLARGLALVEQRPTVTAADLCCVVRVAIDSIPAVRRLALESLAHGGVEDLTTKALAKQVQYSTTTLRRAMEDLQALGLVVCLKGGHADRWTLVPSWRAAVEEFIGGADVLRQLPPCPADIVGAGADVFEVA